ncbi:Lipopolysaccharide-induced tumor necrosis factor-alpha factor -like protein [Collichthys lucidus]|uniref:Lipopolysaccharide-induced tumor necrosis factor-alpha factor-like protein n=1 Tax=Collichthys lucidus TaxID=240159 RepID=A0A4U5VS40_COLLU|nr:Lipopolysaccharide-induced tumor necrosis factor-alpha factor -like protein [Collichthys lucidus]
MEIPDPGQEQEDDSEPNQRTPGGINALTQQAFIEFRVQQLYNRRLLLMKRQSIKKKAEDTSDKTSEITSEEGNTELCELEAVQKEIEELLVKKAELEEQGKISELSNDIQLINTLIGQQDVRPTSYKSEIPRGGIYLLPPPRLTKDITLEQREETRPEEETPTDTAIPVTVNSLGLTPAVTQCPSCQEVIVTQTRSTVGKSMWMLCCMSAMMGCVAGCCLIPFFMDKLKDVRHQCPQCKAHIHTHLIF